MRCRQVSDPLLSDNQINLVFLRCELLVCGVGLQKVLLLLLKLEKSMSWFSRLPAVNSIKKKRSWVSFSRLIGCLKLIFRCEIFNVWRKESVCWRHSSFLILPRLRRRKILFSDCRVVSWIYLQSEELKPSLKSCVCFWFGNCQILHFISISTHSWLHLHRWYFFAFRSWEGIPLWLIFIEFLWLLACPCSVFDQPKSSVCFKLEIQFLTVLSSQACFLHTCLPLPRFWRHPSFEAWG